MNCFSCRVEIPPTFAKAIMDNVCPACGKEIFSSNDFRELIRIKTILNEAGLDDVLTISVAAAISNKYDLVLKSERNKIHSVEKVAEPDTSLTEEEKTRLKAMYAAKKQKEDKEAQDIIKEWGLEQGDFATSTTIKATNTSPTKKLIDPQMAELFSDAMFDENSEIMAPTDLRPSMTNRPGNSERIARAEALRSDPSRFKINRVE